MEDLYLALSISGRNIRKKDPMIISGVFSYNMDDILNITTITENTPNNAYSKKSTHRNRFYRYMNISYENIPKIIIEDKKKEIFVPGLEMVAFSEIIEPFKSDLKKILIHVKDDNHNYIKNIEDIIGKGFNAKIDLITNKQKYSHLTMMSKNLSHNLYVDAIKNKQLPEKYSITPRLLEYEDFISN